MANYYASARSNYFKVKDRKKFEEFIGTLMPDAQIVEGEGGRVGLLFEEGIPSYKMDANEDTVDIDLADELAPHLVDGEVAILIESGAEKLRYICGYAVAVNSKGETEVVNLQDIYKKAQRLGKKGHKITIAEY